jgi:hypothetical protein
MSESPTLRSKVPFEATVGQRKNLCYFIAVLAHGTPNLAVQNFPPIKQAAMARAQQRVTIILDNMSIIMYGWQASRISDSACSDLSVRQSPIATRDGGETHAHMASHTQGVDLLSSADVDATHVTAEAQECPGGYSAIFQLDGEVNHPKTYALQDLLIRPLTWTRVKDFFLTGSGSDSGTFTGIPSGFCCKRPESS